MSLRLLHTMLLALACFAAGCAELSRPEPFLEEVCRAEAGSECVPRALAGTTTEIILRGRNFNQGFEVDLGKDGAPESGNYSAWVGDVAIQQVALAPGRTPGIEELTGLLPGSLDMGIYDVELETPGGQQARLLDAFLITNPLLVVAVAEAGRVPAGYTLGLSVSFENLGSVSLSEVEVNLSQEGIGSLLLPPAPAHFEVEAGAVRTLDFELQANRPGAATVMLDVAAQANQNVEVGPEPTKIDLIILEAASLILSAGLSPPVVAAGEEFELIVDVGCQGETPALEVGLEPVLLTGSGSVELDPVSSHLIDIPAGSQRRFRLRGRALSPGVVEMTPGVFGREAISGRQLGPVTADPIVLEIQ